MTISESVAIMMCTLNGAEYIKEQMESFFRQTHDNWQLWVSDDGSTDETIELIRSFEHRGKVIHVISGPKQGFAANFLNLTRMSISADYFAWSDQDDVWLPDKLSRGIRLLSSNESIPTIYCGRTQLVDRFGASTGLSWKWPRPPSFRNALCQNIVAGNTVIFNSAAKELLSRGPRPDVHAHDWWAYLVISGLGGKVFFDPEPTLLYRQHDDNTSLGGRRTARNYMKRLHRLFSGNSKQWVEANLRALQSIRDSLTLENRRAYNYFYMASQSSDLVRRVWCLARSGVRRQYFLHDVAMYTATLLKQFP